MKKKIKIIIAIVIVIIVYFVKIKTYKIDFDKSEHQEVVYLDIGHCDEEGDWERVLSLLNIQNMDDIELQRDIIDTVSNLKFKFKKITLNNGILNLRPIGIDEEFSLAQTLIDTDDYSIDLLLVTDSMEYSELYVAKYEGFFRIEYKFEEESFEYLNNIIKDYVDKSE